MFLPEKFLLGEEEYSHPEDEEYYHQEDDENEYPEDEESYPEGENSEGYSCDICERDFYSKFQYDKHISEHKTCNLDGCQFTAHEKIVEKHILMQHVTGLYDKIRNINTPEDIAKWIEERKRRYPSKENVLERQERQKELLERGARIKKKDNRFGKDKFRLTKANTKIPPPKQRPKRPFIVEKKPVSLINEKLDWNGAVFPFRGTSMLETDTSDNRESDFEEEEWQPPVKPVQVELNNALGALMGAYMSDEECSEEEVKHQKIEDKKTVIESKPVVENTVNTVSTNSDDEPPTEVKIEKTHVPETATVVEETPSENKIVSATRTRKRHRPEKRQGKPDRFKNNKRNTVQKKYTNKSDLPYAFRRRKVTLLEKLLESEIRQERNILLQCVRYVVKNNFFRAVENSL